MDIGEILVLALSVPAMCLLLIILTRMEEWLRDDTEDGWAPRPAAARRPPLWPVRTTSHIRHICHDPKHLAKLLVLRANRPVAACERRRVPRVQAMRTRLRWLAGLRNP